MLARIAHELYWIGRYVARADDTARMLDGLFRASLQAPGGPGTARLPWETVMTALGARPDPDEAPVSASEAVRSLTLDADSPASVTACVARARDGAKRVRDVVSREMWQTLNTLYLELDTSDLGSALRTGPYSVYAFVRERCALWWGLADETMLRDQAYAFLAAGRHAEGASMMLRMLRVSIVPSLALVDESGSSAEGPAPALLQAIGGLEAFRRSVPGPADAYPVAKFLLFEPTYPHSVAAALELVHGRLRDADPSYRTAAPLLRLARLRAELEFHRGGPPQDGGEGLASLLEHVQRELSEADAEIERRYFSGAAAQPHVVTA
jgi:uncharacterized alpha-E superfamily protein